MKKNLLFFLLLMAIPGILLAQIPVKESEVPEAVKTKLGNLFPGFSGVQWTKHNTDFHAGFVYDDVKVVSKFSETGRWIASESEYKLDLCPRSLQKHATSNYASCKIGKILLVETKDISEYRIEMQDTVTSQKLFAYYDVSGNFVRKSDSQGNEQDLNMTSGNDKGKLPVHPKELPSSVNSYVIINYSDYTIKESYIVNNETFQNAYYLILQKADDASKIELWFDFQGTLVKVGNQSTQTDNGGQSDKPDKNNNKKNVRQPISESKVPTLAVQAFTKKEPKAEEVRWDTIGKEYVVSYFNPAKGIECRMHFDNKGNHVKSITILNPRDLLPLIQTYIEQNYYDLDIESAENVTFADKSKFTIVKLFSPNWANDPMVFHEIYFTTSGRLEKEVLANYIDADDVYQNQQDDDKNRDFNEYIEGDDLSLDEGAMVDGQIVTLRELPSITIKYLSDNYPSYRYSEGIIINDENVLKYSVIMKREGFSDRKRILFDLKGKFLKEEDF